MAERRKRMHSRNSNAQGNAENRQKAVARALVATGDTRKRCA
jgi:hypothetical protein